MRRWERRGHPETGVNSRNCRADTVELAIPKLRHGTYFRRSWGTAAARTGPGHEVPGNPPSPNAKSGSHPQDNNSAPGCTARNQAGQGSPDRATRSRPDTMPHWTKWPTLLLISASPTRGLRIGRSRRPWRICQAWLNSLLRNGQITCSVTANCCPRVYLNVRLPAMGRQSAMKRSGTG